MNIFRNTIKRAVPLFVALLAVLLAVPAAARDMTRKLKGDYAVSVSMDCTTSVGAAGPQSGFDPVTLERLGPGEQFNANYQGVSTFDGKGNSTFEGEVLVIGHGGIYGATQYSLDCFGPYTVSADMMVTSEVTCAVLQITDQPGLPPGIPVMLSGAITEGRLFGAKRGLIMLRSDTAPTIETYTLPDWLPPPMGGAYVKDRICGKSGTAVRIWN